MPFGTSVRAAMTELTKLTAVHRRHRSAVQMHLMPGNGLRSSGCRDRMDDPTRCPNRKFGLLRPRGVSFTQWSAAMTTPP